MSETLLDYLDKRLGVGVAKDSGELDYYCPFCLDRLGDESSKPKLGINIDLQKAHCFRCGYGAPTLAKLFRDLNGGGKLTAHEIALLRSEVVRHPDESVDEAVRRLYRESAKDTIAKRVKLKPLPTPQGMVKLAKEDPEGRCRRAFRYLATRGVTREHIERFDLRYSRFGDYAGYVMCPVRVNGKLLYWTNRSIRPDDNPKTRNPPKEDGYYSKRHVLLNYDNCIGEPVVTLSEGLMDVIVQPAAVGVLGLHLSREQLCLLAGLVETGTREFVIMLDAGEAEATERWYRKLEGVGADVSVVTLSHGDPNSRRDELPELMKTRGPMDVESLITSMLRYSK